MPEHTNPYEIDTTPGAGATIVYYSDRRACTVAAVSKSGKRVEVQHDEAVLLNGPESGEADALTFHPGGFCGHMSGTQRYAYTPTPEGARYAFTLRKNGRWVREGESMNSGAVLVAGRSEYYDYNF